MPVKQHSFTSSYPGLSRVLANQVIISRAYIPPEPPPDIIRKKYNAICDTGATNSVITQKVAQECKLKPTGMTIVYHAGGKKDVNTYLVNILLPNKVEMY